MIEKEIDIQELKFPENVRTRPGMYIGDTDNADVLLREVVDNSIDEMFGSIKGTKVWIEELGDYYLVADNGRGIPILMDPEKGITKTELAMTTLHAGSKFQKQEIAVGMNGVGTSAVNALSKEFAVLSKITEENWDKSIPVITNDYSSRKDKSVDLYYIIVFNDGIKVHEGSTTIAEASEELGITLPEDYSTYTLFIPDGEIFTSTKAKAPRKNLIYSNLVLSHFKKKQADFYVNGEYVAEGLALYDYKVLHKVNPQHPTKNEFVDVLISFDFDEDLSYRETQGSINSLVVNRGFHINIGTDLITNAFKRHYGITHNHLKEGLKVFVLMAAPEPSFTSQTKENCSGFDGIRRDDFHAIENELIKIFKSKEDYFKLHAERLNEYAESVKNISTIEKIKSMVNISDLQGSRAKSYLPPKLKDASHFDRSKTELFITEGDSAGGNIIIARDPEIHAMLPTGGRPLNSIYKTYDELFDNEDMKNIVSTIGLGVNDYHSVEKPRYGKIIITADADPDGMGISALFVGALMFHMTFLIDHKMLFVVETPIFKQEGRYIYPGEEDTLLNDKPFTRFKGLGELNVDDVTYTIINPETRRLKLITKDGMSDALELLTSKFARKSLMVKSGVLTDPYNLLV